MGIEEQDLDGSLTAMRAAGLGREAVAAALSLLKVRPEPRAERREWRVYRMLSPASTPVKGLLCIHLYREWCLYRMLSPAAVTCAVTCAVCCARTSLCCVRTSLCSSVSPPVYTDCSSSVICVRPGVYAALSLLKVAPSYYCATCVCSCYYCAMCVCFCYYAAYVW
jgi:hypothetical protein